MSGRGCPDRRGRYHRQWRPGLFVGVCCGGVLRNPDLASGVTTTCQGLPTSPPVGVVSCCSCSASGGLPFDTPSVGCGPRSEAEAPSRRDYGGSSGVRDRDHAHTTISPAFAAGSPGDLRPPCTAPRCYHRSVSHRLPTSRQTPNAAWPCSTDPLPTIGSDRSPRRAGPGGPLVEPSGGAPGSQRNTVGPRSTLGRARGASHDTGFDARATLDASGPHEAAAPERCHVSVGIGPPGCVRPWSFDLEASPVLPPVRRARCSPKWFWSAPLPEPEGSPTQRRSRSLAPTRGGRIARFGWQFTLPTRPTSGRRRADPGSTRERGVAGSRQEPSGVATGMIPHERSERSSPTDGDRGPEGRAETAQTSRSEPPAQLPGVDPPRPRGPRAYQMIPR
jgi:hypothetical protein